MDRFWLALILLAAAATGGCEGDSSSATPAKDAATTGGSDTSAPSDSQGSADATAPDTTTPADGAGPSPDVPAVDVPPADIPLVPGRCWRDKDCAADEFCEPRIELKEWYGACAKRNAAGAALGAPCDDDTPCANDAVNLCRNGFCSALCYSDAECNAGADQVCAAEELRFDYDADPEVDAVQFISHCDTIVGRGNASCFSDAACPAGQECRFWMHRNTLDADGTQLHPDGPYTIAGVCRTPPAGRAAYGKSCYVGADCQSGLCNLFTCTKLCESQTECGEIDDGGFAVLAICRAQRWSGFHVGPPEHRTTVSMCEGASLSDKVDCSGDFTCSDEQEACLPHPIAFGPTYKAKFEYLCGRVAGSDKELGESCTPGGDPDSGGLVEECASGGCARKPGGGGICTKTCAPGDNASCAAIAPGMSCQVATTFPRQGGYAGNAASFTACYFEGLVGPAQP